MQNFSACLYIAINKTGFNKQPNSHNNMQFKCLLRPLALFLLLICMPNISFANAGMIVISEDEGQTLVLLVKPHNSKSFTFPGGKVASNNDNSKDEHDSHYETAIRETMEETRGYLTEDQLEQASVPFSKIQIKKHTLYLAKIPFFDIDEIFKILIPRGRAWKAMREIDDYAWVNINDISAASERFVKTHAGKEIKLKKIVKKAIHAGQADSWF